MRRVDANGGDEYSTPSICITRNTKGAIAFGTTDPAGGYGVTRVTSTRHPPHTEHNMRHQK